LVTALKARAGNKTGWLSFKRICYVRENRNGYPKFLEDISLSSLVLASIRESNGCGQQLASKVGKDTVKTSISPCYNHRKTKKNIP
jgi:hypothetical protein